MRALLPFVAVVLALPACAAAADPWVAWACSPENLARIPVLPVKLPVAPADAPSTRVDYGELRYVDAKGAATRAPTGHPGPTLLLADASAPTSAVLAGLAGAERPVWVALAPASPPRPPPDDDPVKARLGPLRMGGEAALAEIDAACPAFAAGRASVGPGCPEQAELVSRALAECRNRRVDLEAALLAMQSTALKGVPVVLVPLPEGEASGWTACPTPRRSRVATRSSSSRRARR